MNRLNVSYSGLVVRAREASGLPRKPSIPEGGIHYQCFFRGFKCTSKAWNGTSNRGMEWIGWILFAEVKMLRIVDTCSGKLIGMRGYGDVTIGLDYGVAYSSSTLHR